MTTLARVPALADRQEQRGLLALAMVVVCIALPLLMFERTTASMVAIWSRSETFSHCFAVIPIVLWLIWQRRHVLASLPATPWAPGIALLAITGAAWLLMDLAEANAPSQFLLIAMVPLLVLTVLGKHWLRALAFPLGFLFFAVPFGEVIVPWLMDRTADFTVAALKLSGIPVYREGNRFMIPTGAWSVVEACSGIRYLIASMMLGVLYAQLMYRSTARRIAFIAAATVVPIVANWLRAYLIVMLGHLTRNELAVGVDHLIYGWLFFGLVISALFVAGARWREHVPAPQATGPHTPPERVDSGIHFPAALAAIAACLALLPWSVAAERLRQPGAIQASTAPAIATPELAAAAGWTSRPTVNGWQPHLVGPTWLDTRSFSDGRHVVTVTIGYFARQTSVAQTVTASNQLAPSEGRWIPLESGRAAAQIGADVVRPVSTVLRSGPETLLTWRWYWLADGPADSDVRAKLRLAWARLRGASDAGAWIVIHTPVATDVRAAAAVLDRFAQQMGPSLHRALAEAGGGRR